MTSNSRRELLESLRPAYAVAEWSQKVEILDNVVAATGYNRKHATCLLAGSQVLPTSKRQRSRTYDDSLHAHLSLVWLAANRICSKRLVALLPVLVPTLEAQGYLTLCNEDRLQLLSISAATVDRLLKKDRREFGPRKRNASSGNRLRKQIPLRTGPWADPHVGFCEVDLVTHGGQSAAGDFLHTLTVTDIATGWTENQCLLNRTEENVLRAIKAVARDLPVLLLGIDSDNGGEFINHRLKNYCETEGIEFTRSREYRKNDQAHVEQKNGAIVRKLVGYDRFEGNHSCELMTALYRVSRLYNNFFQPSFKLLSKTRMGSRVVKHHDAPKTPYQRMLDNESVSATTKEKLRLVFASLDPVQLLMSMQTLQSKLWHSGLSDPEAFVRSIAAPKLHRPKPIQKYRPKPLPHSRPGRKRDTELDIEIWQELDANPKLGLWTLQMILKSRYGDSAPSKTTTSRKMNEWRDRHPEFAHLYPKQSSYSQKETKSVETS